MCLEQAADPAPQASARRDLQGHWPSHCLPVRPAGRGRDVPVVRGLQVSQRLGWRLVPGADRPLQELAKHGLPEHLQSQCLAVCQAAQGQDVPVVPELQVFQRLAARPVPAADRRLREPAKHGLQGHWRSQSFPGRRVARESDGSLGQALQVRRGRLAWLGQLLRSGRCGRPRLPSLQSMAAAMDRLSPGRWQPPGLEQPEHLVPAERRVGQRQPPRSVVSCSVHSAFGSSRC